MNYVIVPIEWCVARGILVTPEERKSLDNSKVIKHDNMLSPFDLTGMKIYAHDSAELWEILESDEWTKRNDEGEPEPGVTETSDYGVLAGLTNAENTAKARIQTMGLTDTESLKMKSWYPEWESMTGKQLNVGEKYQCDGKLWKVLQQHTAQEEWKPGEGTESLFTEVSESHSGTKEDPIPYDNNMELEAGKYYSQDGVTYLCNRDTGIPVYNALKDLVGLYVEVAE